MVDIIELVMVHTCTCWQ